MPEIFDNSGAGYADQMYGNGTRPSGEKRYWELRAFCTSKTCTKTESMHDFAEKCVGRQVAFCPDCGFALFWKRVPTGTINIIVE